MKLGVVPQSLFGRLLTALLATMGIALLVVVALLLNERRDRLAGNETALTVNLIVGTVNMLANLPAEQRAEQIARRDTTQIFGGPREGPQPTQNPAVAALELERELTEALGGAYRVAVTPVVGGFGPGGARPGESRPRPETERGREERPPPNDGPRREPFGGGPPPPNDRRFGARELDVAVLFPTGELVKFRTDVPRAPPPLPVALLAELLLVTLVLGAVLYAMARTIARPLAELAAAAEAVGRGARHLPLRETGARELREATHAFNTMQERLNRYLDSRTRVLAAMSHDLRTPLTRLKLRAELLDDEALRDRFNADLDEMQRMVTGALNLFRGMNHDEPLAPVAVDALVDELRGELAELGTQVAVTGAAGAPLLARRSALKRCLTNLLSNAAKYGTNPTVVLEDSSAELVLRVQDDGPGIPPEMLEQVFEPFFRLERSRSADTGGVGLGLCIARDIAQGHGGSLTLRNRTPHGLEAVLRLPRTAVP
jgi:signal transduction histidine kinase